MGRRIVCTDIHGCYHSFKSLLEEKVKLHPDDNLFFLGDAINKGPFSREVLDYLMAMDQDGYKLSLLRGNHEQELLNVLNGKTGLDIFVSKGGETLLNNFGVRHPGEIPEKYIRFIRGFEHYVELPDFFLVHAGFNFNKVNPFVDSEEMLNIRGYEVDLNKTNGRRIIHGHSPVALEEIKSTIAEKADKHFSIDAGCVYHRNPEQAHLVALDLDEWKLFIQPNIDVSSNYSG